MQWIESLGGAFNAIPNWIPVITSIVATAVSVLAFTRSTPPVLPRAWIEVRGRGQNGASLALRLENHTSWPVQLHDMTVKQTGVEVSHSTQPITDKDKPWRTEGYTDYAWGKSLTVGRSVAPNGSVDFPFAIRLPDSSSWIKPSIHLSISTMHRTVRQRTIVMPVMIPAATNTNR